MKAVTLGHNKYCGPAVLSIVTGKSTDECAAVISSINGKYKVEGVTVPELTAALKRLRFTVEDIPVHGFTLFGALPHLRNHNGMYIVMVPRHFVCIEVNNESILFCDNHTKEPMDASGAARLTQRCEAIYKVAPQAEPKLISSEIVLEVTNQSTRKYVAISRRDTYDDSDCDRETSLGSIYSTPDELKQIINELIKISQ